MQVSKSSLKELLRTYRSGTTLISLCANQRSSVAPAWSLGVTQLISTRFRRGAGRAGFSPRPRVSIRVRWQRRRRIWDSSSSQAEIAERRANPAGQSGEERRGDNEQVVLCAAGDWSSNEAQLLFFEIL